MSKGGMREGIKLRIKLIKKINERITMNKEQKSVKKKVADFMYEENISFVMNECFLKRKGIKKNKSNK